MKKEWVRTAALVFVASALSSAATALYMSKHNEKLLADAQQATRPVPVPVWFLGKLREAFVSPDSDRKR